MSDATLVLVLLAAGSYLLKSLGPLVLGGERALPAWCLDRACHFVTDTDFGDLEIVDFC